MKNKKNYIKTNILIIIAIVLAVAAIGVTAVHFSSGSIKKSIFEISVSETSSLVDETATLIQMHVEERSGMMMRCAVRLGRPDTDKRSVLNSYADSVIFDVVKYYGFNGESYSSNNIEIPIDSQTALEKIADGEGKAVYDDNAENIFNYYIYPVTDLDGEVIGAAVGAVRKIFFEQIISSAALSAYGEIYICNSDGTVVFSRSSGEKTLANGANIVMDNVFCEKHRTQLKSIVAMKSQKGSFEHSIGEKPYTALYSSLNTQGWTLLVITSLSSVSDKYDGIVSSSNTFIITITIMTGLVVIAMLILFGVEKAKVILMTKQKENETDKDSLTGYMSDRAFKEKCVQRMVDMSQNYAMISIDIDKFKTINDKLGYDGGNSVIQRVADIINRNLDADDMFARDSGDLFNILCAYKNEEEIIAKIKNIIEDADYQISECKLMFSAGIFPIKNRTLSMRAICDRSNVARRSIKNIVTKSHAFFNDKMLESLKNEHEIESIMEEALEKKEFKVYLQPKFNMHDTSELVGAEALVRWIHGDRFISPGEFIPCFEKNGFVKKLDFYMFEEVCRLQCHWLNSGLKMNTISVNMSRLHLHDDDFADTLAGICAKYSISPSYFEIEITESAADEKIDVLLPVFRNLHSKGFKISIDDFGTGYSSLNMLKDLPVDVLKIDRDFLGKQDATENAKVIISHVISLAVALNIRTICEGIETEEQSALLKELGCDMAQGFLFARPMPIADYEKLAYGDAINEQAQKGTAN